MRWVKLIVVLLVIAVIAAFTVQNTGRTADLSLDLGFAAWKLARPATVAALVWASFGAGLLLAGTWGFVRGVALARRVRQLEQQIALGGASAPSSDSWRG